MRSREIVPPAEMEEAVFTDDKQTREENIRVITEKTGGSISQTTKSILRSLVRLYTSIRRRQYER